MASRVEEILDIVSEKSRFVPMGTEQGMRRLKRMLYSSLNTKAVEDEISVVKKVDLSIIEEILKDGLEFDAASLYVDVIPKLDVSKIPVKKVSNVLVNNLQYEGIRTYSHNGVQCRNQYQMPLKRFSKKRAKECFLVYNIKNGRLEYPSYKDYRAPMIKFDCYRNMDFGRKVVKLTYDTLSRLSEKR